MMKIEDAVNLILFASRVRCNETYILDMGPAYKILDLAKIMLKYSLYYFDEDMVEFIGLEQGEKLSEVLFTDAEKNSMIRDKQIFLLKNTQESILTDDEFRSIYSDDLSSLQDIFSRILL